MKKSLLIFSFSPKAGEQEIDFRIIQLKKFFPKLNNRPVIINSSIFPGFGVNKKMEEIFKRVLKALRLHKNKKLSIGTTPECLEVSNFFKHNTLSLTSLNHNGVSEKVLIILQEIFKSFEGNGIIMIPSPIADVIAWQNNKEIHHALTPLIVIQEDGELDFRAI